METMEIKLEYDWSTTQKREDGSYIVMCNGLPCQLIANDPMYADAWKQADEYAKTHSVETVSAVLPMTAEQMAQIATAEIEAQRLPDVEDATIDLAAYIAELEERIAVLEGK